MQRAVRRTDGGTTPPAGDAAPATRRAAGQPDRPASAGDRRTGSPQTTPGAPVQRAAAQPEPGSDAHGRTAPPASGTTSDAAQGQAPVRRADSRSAATPA
ncbi:hypothetical protein ACN6LL_001912, partial [Streptomyces violaceoruber]